MDLGSLYYATLGRDEVFRFRTLESFITTPVGYKEYGRGAVGRINQLDNKSNNIISMQIPTRAQYAKKVAEGGFGTVVYGFDWHTKQAIAVSHNILETKFATTNRDMRPSNDPFAVFNLSAKAAQGGSRPRLVSLNFAPDILETRTADIVARRQIYAATLDSVGTVKVYGDFNIGVGSAIGLSLPAVQMNPKSTKGSIDSQRYVVMRANHQLVRDKDRFTFTQTFEFLISGYRT